MVLTQTQNHNLPSEPWIISAILDRVLWMTHQDRLIDEGILPSEGIGMRSPRRAVEAPKANPRCRRHGFQTSEKTKEKPMVFDDFPLAVRTRVRNWLS